ncbi:MAG: 3-methylitaconate isomerase [Deltaproteobacteria bacterium]|jgi:2-methylaconitate cis-trans-isomerase PrpF|nr:3-methylitaconate isomerase [Deltaproteobacteria bacterium]
MQKRIPSVVMRGGTSKGIFFHDNHLPRDAGKRDQVILTAFGSPDPYRRQIDGLGGAVSTTSKTAIISRSTNPAYDVVYNFGQVSIDRPLIDYKGNCGNISSAVGPFAVDEGLVPAVEPMTTVRIHQKNTDKLIMAEVPVKNGRYDETGDYAISGVPGTGGKITLRFSDPGGAVTGRLLPTGNTRDTLEVPGLGSVEVTIIDAANPVVLVAAAQIGLSGIEIEAIEANRETKDKLEAIRCAAAVVTGITKTAEEATRMSQAVPKIACVAVPQTYIASSGQEVSADAIDLTVRIMSMGTLHGSIAVSVAIATAGAVMIPGTVPFNLKGTAVAKGAVIHLGHPGGIVDVGATIEMRSGEPHYVEAAVGRTARRLMEGYVLVPERCFR